MVLILMKHANFSRYFAFFSSERDANNKKMQYNHSNNLLEAKKQKVYSEISHYIHMHTSPWILQLIP